MPSAQDNEFLNHVLDLLQDFGPVKARKMFGAYGIFMEGVMFALIFDDMLYFKVDQESVAKFEALDLPPFVYNQKGKDVVMSFSQAPDQALEDEETMHQWATLACDAAMRAASNKR